MKTVMNLTLLQKIKCAIAKVVPTTESLESLIEQIQQIQFGVWKELFYSF
jgi:hypothetical protein